MVGGVPGDAGPTIRVVWSIDMTVACEIDKLTPFLEYLDNLTARAPVPELCRWLSELDIGPEDVAAFARFDPRQYLRNLICCGEHYHLLVLCWSSGQRSPVHHPAG